MLDLITEEFFNLHQKFRKFKQRKNLIVSLITTDLWLVSHKSNPCEKVYDASTFVLTAVLLPW